MNGLLILLGYCGVYAAWVLVPLPPAILIYRLFPAAQTFTQWNISGIVLKAGGASGFYFAILGLAFFKFIDPAIDNIKAWERPYWEVKAPLAFYDAHRKPINATSSSDELRVQPLAYEFKKIGDRRYLAKLRFSEPNAGIPNYIRLIFPEGEGFIQLKNVMNDANTDWVSKVIDLTAGDPIPIRPIIAGGQNPSTSTGFSKHINKSLESAELR